MQIGIDASRVAVAARTGTEHYTYELLAALARRDRRSRYTLYCNQRPAALPPLGANFALRRIPFPRLWSHARLSAELLLRPPDTLFVPAHVLPLGAPLARRMRTVVTIHDMGYLHFPEAHTPAQRLYLRLSTAWSARAATRLIAISGATRDDLVRYAGARPEKIAVIHHGVSPRFRPVEDTAAIEEAMRRYGIAGAYLLYVGTVQPRKNLARLIEAFAQTLQIVERRLQIDDPHLQSTICNLQLVIAGKRGWLTEAIERRAAELGVADRVVFAGYVADDDLPALLSGALAFVFPSLYEGFGMPVLEAMACGAPVLAANTSSLPEVAGGAALLVDPADTGAIADGLARLSADAGLRADLRARGRERAAAFTWDRCAEQTLRVLLGG
ncbi:MAG: glycosyltransferase family 4 protein [Kouleothrix sp.]|nr:glycosyltransferase family 4 protein [Kouleothrix sp.]